MAKNSIKQIEKDERKVLNELLKQANKSINEIAKKCKFSRQKVWRIIKKLESKKIIWGYVSVIDEEKIDKKEFIVLIRRSNLPLNRNMVDKIVKRKLDQEAQKLGIEIMTSMYANGVYDWVIYFCANNIKDAKRFSESLNKIFEGYISEIQLLEKMFTAKKYGIENPDIKKLNDFFNL